jgi:hypothetical protein
VAAQQRCCRFGGMEQGGVHCSVPQQLQEVTRQQVAARVGCFGSAGLAAGVVVVPLMRTAVAIGPEVLQ